MNTSKPIDISKSSLISLKAELSRKQDEVNSSKASKPGSYTCPLVNPKKKAMPGKKKQKIETERGEDTIETNTEDVDNDDALKKSREILEIKSKLYDQLQDAQLVVDSDRGADYLVNFTKKAYDNQNEVSKEPPTEVESIEDDYESDPPSDPENDWVDFVDVLGRSRRCLRRDLADMRKKNDKLADNLHPPVPPAVQDPEGSSGFTDRIPEMISNDMHREMMRKKWEEQEKKLLNKNDIHYQDVLFDEARTHGVGYYAFSTNEEERLRQQDELEQRRKETLRHQEEAKGLRARRNQQLEARLNAARARNRQRLGLPPLPTDQDQQTDKDVTEVKPEDDNSKLEGLKTKELEETLKKAAHVRPWDIGKDGVKTTVNVMSQEEWVDKKRDERISEFAPPVMYTEDRLGDQDLFKRNQSSLFFTSKKKANPQQKQKRLLKDESRNRMETHSRSKPIVKMKTCGSDSEDDEETKPKRKRAEIPPPLTAEYFGTASTSKRKEKNKTKNDLEQSITEGLKYLRKKQEQKVQKQEKGLLDIV